MSARYFYEAIDRDVKGTVVFKSNILATSIGQRYMVVVNKIVWYAVRIFIEIDPRYYIHIYSVKISEHLSADRAIQKHEEIKKYMSESPPNFAELSLSVTDGVFFVVPNSDPSILQPGDHVQVVRKGLYSHAGIFMDAGSIIYFSNEGDGKSKNSSSVRSEDWSRFYGLDRAVVFIYSTFFKCRSTETIIKEAKELIGTREGEYNILMNNCQHFATLCQTGVEKQTDLIKILPYPEHLKTIFSMVVNTVSDSDKIAFTNYRIHNGAMLHHPTMPTYLIF